MELRRQPARPVPLLTAALAVIAFWIVLQVGGQAAGAVPPHGDPAGAPVSLEATPLLFASAALPEPERERADDSGLRLPATGSPVLRVREGARVELRDGPGGSLVERLGSRTEFDSPTVLSVQERQGNWAGVPTHLLPNGELGWVELDPRKLKIDSVGMSIVVDVSDRHAKLYRGDRVERSWTVSVGAAESPTPLGRFSVTDSIRGGLNPSYGCCALALSATQPNLPEGWSGGDRMAIHGTPEEIGVANSMGCVRSGDADISTLVDLVPLGTPVTLKP